MLRYFLPQQLRVLNELRTPYSAALNSFVNLTPEDHSWSSSSSGNKSSSQYAAATSRAIIASTSNSINGDGRNGIFAGGRTFYLYFSKILNYRHCRDENDNDVMSRSNDARASERILRDEDDSTTHRLRTTVDERCRNTTDSCRVRRLASSSRSLAGVGSAVTMCDHTGNIHPRPALCHTTVTGRLATAVDRARENRRVYSRSDARAYAVSPPWRRRSSRPRSASVTQRCANRRKPKFLFSPPSTPLVS